MKRHSVFRGNSTMCPASAFRRSRVYRRNPRTQDGASSWRRLNADRRSSHLASSRCSLHGIIFVNCRDPTAIPRAVGDLVSPSISQISELSFAPAVSMRDNSRDGIIARHKRDSDKSLSLCDHWEPRELFSRCYRKAEGFIMLEESRRDSKDNNQACAIFMSYLTFVVLGNVTLSCLLSIRNANNPSYSWRLLALAFAYSLLAYT